MEKVYLPWFTREHRDGDDTDLLIGVYQGEADAKAAIERVKNQPGFVNFPEGFLIDPYELGKDHWTEGFVRMAGDREVPE